MAWMTRAASRCCAIWRRPVAGSGARIALMELVVESKAGFASAAFDMQMFMATRGRERTLTEWRKLFDQAEWTLEEVVGLQSLVKILVLRLRD